MTELTDNSTAKPTKKQQQHIRHTVYFDHSTTTCCTITDPNVKNFWPFPDSRQTSDACCN